MRVLIVCLCLLSAVQIGVAQKVEIGDKTKISHSVFQVDFSCPTADKPQSKLWYMDNSWWAILPKSNGPSLWQRSSSGWIEYPEVNKMLTGVPGRADVCFHNGAVTAVGVGSKNLVMFCLEKNVAHSKQTWTAKKLVTLRPQLTEKQSIETATIAFDSEGNCWVAAIAGGRVCVWSAAGGGQHWKGPFVLAEGIGKDDICTIAEIPGGVGVIWSDQLNEAVKFCQHTNGKAWNKWEKLTLVDQGHKTADDHLNTALSTDGTLWVTTKNSLDRFGEAQFVLRVRHPNGEWKNFPYCKLDSLKQPSRPIILTVADNPSLVLNAYTIYNYPDKYLGQIVAGKIDTTQRDIIGMLSPVIRPDTTGWSGKNLINNVTGSKMPLPKGAPWIVLASDNEGRVYETDLSAFFQHE